MFDILPYQLKEKCLECQKDILTQTFPNSIEYECNNCDNLKYITENDIIKFFVKTIIKMCKVSVIYNLTKGYFIKYNDYGYNHAFTLINKTNHINEVIINFNQKEFERFIKHFYQKNISKLIKQNLNL